MARAARSRLRHAGFPSSGDALRWLARKPIVRYDDHILTKYPNLLRDMRIPASYMMNLEEFCSAEVYRAALGAAGITSEQIRGAPGQVTGEQFLQFTEYAYRKYERDYPPSLLVGRRISVSAHGFLGFAILSSQTMRQAIDLGVKYSHLAMPFFDWNVEIDSGIGLYPRLRVDLGACEDMLVEIGICVMKSLVDMFPHAIERRDLRIDFAHKNRFSLGDYEDFFGVPARFCSERTGIWGPSVELDSPLPMGNEAAVRMLEQQLQRQAEALQISNPWTQKVQAYCDGEIRRVACISKEEVADHLCVTTRTLTRKLSGEGETFKRVIDSIVMERAVALLRDPGLGVQEIADQLGYSSSKNFSSSFKRLTGQSPSEYRNKAPR